MIYALFQGSADLWADLLSDGEVEKKPEEAIEEAVEPPPPKRKKGDEAVPVMKCAICEKASKDHRDCT
jgi:hypothetical protein